MTRNVCVCGAAREGEVQEQQQQGHDRQVCRDVYKGCVTVALVASLYDAGVPAALKCGGYSEKVLVLVCMWLLFIRSSPHQN